MAAARQGFVAKLATLMRLKKSAHSPAAAALLSTDVLTARFDALTFLTTADPRIRALHQHGSLVGSHELFQPFRIVVAFELLLGRATTTTFLDWRAAERTFAVMARFAAEMLSAAQHSRTFVLAHWQSVQTRGPDHGRRGLAAGTAGRRVDASRTAGTGAIVAD